MPPNRSSNRKKRSSLVVLKLDRTVKANTHHINAYNFAPTVTPDTWPDAPSLPPRPNPDGQPIFRIQPPSPPTTDEAKKPRKKVGKKKDNPGYIPRPPNAFMLFRSNFIKTEQLPKELGTSGTSLSKIVADVWANLSEPEREPWRVQAAYAKEDHKKAYPDYVYKPNHNKNKDKEVRSGEPSDIRVIPQPSALPKRAPCSDEFALAVSHLVRKGVKGDALTSTLHENGMLHYKILPPTLPPTPSPETAAGRGRTSSRSFAPARRSSSVPLPTNASGAIMIPASHWQHLTPQVPQQEQQQLQEAMFTPDSSSFLQSNIIFQDAYTDLPRRPSTVGPSSLFRPWATNQFFNTMPPPRELPPTNTSLFEQSFLEGDAFASQPNPFTCDVFPSNAPLMSHQEVIMSPLERLDPTGSMEAAASHVPPYDHTLSYAPTDPLSSGSSWNAQVPPTNTPYSESIVSQSVPASTYSASPESSDTSLPLHAPQPVRPADPWGEFSKPSPAPTTYEYDDSPSPPESSSNRYSPEGSAPPMQLLAQQFHHQQFDHQQLPLSLDDDLSAYTAGLQRMSISDWVMTSDEGVASAALLGVDAGAAPGYEYHPGVDASAALSSEGGGYDYQQAANSSALLSAENRTVYDYEQEGLGMSAALSGPEAQVSYEYQSTPTTYGHDHGHGQDQLASYASQDHQPSYGEYGMMPMPAAVAHHSSPSVMDAAEHQAVVDMIQGVYAETGFDAIQQHGGEAVVSVDSMGHGHGHGLGDNEYDYNHFTHEITNEF